MFRNRTVMSWAGQRPSRQFVSSSVQRFDGWTAGRFDASFGSTCWCFDGWTARGLADSTSRRLDGNL
eukprot:891239-Heterocapsa_arctica.AAC.1